MCNSDFNPLWSVLILTNDTNSHLSLESCESLCDIKQFEKWQDSTDLTSIQNVGSITNTPESSKWKNLSVIKQAIKSKHRNTLYCVHLIVIAYKAVTPLFKIVFMLQRWANVINVNYGGNWNKRVITAVFLRCNKTQSMVYSEKDWLFLILNFKLQH